MKTKRNLTALVATGVLTAISVSGCSKPEPDIVLSNAIEKQKQNSEMSVKLSVDTDSETLLKILKEAAQGKDVPADDQEIAKNLMSYSATFEAKSRDGKPIAEKTKATDINYGLFVDSGDTRVANLMAVDDNVFAKLDAKKFSDDFKAYDEAEFKQFMNDIPNLAIKDLLSNKWVGLDDNLSKSFKESLKSSEETTGVKNPGALTSDETKKLQEATKKNLDANSTYSYDDEDIKVDVMPKKFVNQFVKDANAIRPNYIDDTLMESVNETLGYLKDDKPFTITMKVRDEKLTQIKFDVMQLYKIADPNKMKTQEEKDKVAKYAGYNIYAVLDFSDKAPTLSKPNEYTKMTQEDFNSLAY